MTAEFAPNVCGSACTVVQTGSSDPKAVLASPVNGAIVDWRIREASSSFKYRLRVVTPGPAPVFVGTGSSAPVSPAGAALQAFPTKIPIRAGQMIGIDLEPGAPIGFNPTVGSYVFFASPLPEGSAAEGGAQSGELAFNADIQPAPTISGISPVSGSIAGATVTITGSDLEGATGVAFGSVPASSYAVNSESQITAVAPPSATVASVPVSVTTVAGSASSPQLFTYEACTVPKLKGSKLKAAKKKLRIAGCALGKIHRAKGVTAKTGRVVKQGAKPGQVRPPGSKVGIKLG